VAVRTSSCTYGLHGPADLVVWALELRGAKLLRIISTGREGPAFSFPLRPPHPLLDVDLGGVTNSVSWLQHLEDPSNAAGTATDTSTPVATAQGLVWSARTHDALEVTNPALKNAQRHSSGYRLVPLVTGGGLTQHYEPFTHSEFWITPYDPGQFAAKNLPT
jgi:hypothetical protein